MFDKDKHPSFCILPWIHLFVSTTGTLRPCCVSKEFENRHKIFEEGVEGFINSQDMKNLRTELLSNNKPKICSVCWDKEKNGDKHSKRLGELSIWEQKVDITTLIENTLSDGEITENLMSYDLRLGNLCNLKCIMCNPNSSSKWLEDKDILGKYDNTGFHKNSLANLKWPEREDLWNHLENNYSNIKIMQFAGGEPLLHKKHTKLLQDLVSAGYSKDIFLKYNTNITILPDTIFELWSQFRRVDLWCSIDGYGELNDYIRFPSKWSTMVDSLDRLDNSGANINVRINSAISALNVEYIPELYNFILNKQYKKVGMSNGSLHIAPDIVYDPEHLNIRILPDIAKDKITQKLKAHLATVNNQQYINQLNYVITYMNNESWNSRLYTKFLTYIEEIERIRGNRYPYELYK